MHTAVAGLAWGDEGKGKVVDVLCPAFDVVVRYNGGANAGHTVKFSQESFALHLLPTGVLHSGMSAVIGPGVVVDPIGILEEIDALSSRGHRIGDRLRISDRAHLVLEYHKAEDKLSEQAAGGAGRIGTTSRGIGPCYADKMRRTSAIRMCDLLHADVLRAKVERITASKSHMLSATFGDSGGLNPDALLAQLSTCAERLCGFICDTTEFLGEAMNAGKRILFEGANGSMLDVDHGTYPFVTSSSTGPWGIAGGAGVPPGCTRHHVGVTKAYCTRVGSGPFPTELTNEIGVRIRERGREFGTTTGRPRRCGWFDAVVVRRAVFLGGVTEIALMHLDTLSGFDKVQVCTGYRLGDQTLQAPPPDAETFDQVIPVYETMPGWAQDLRGIRSLDDLPDTTRSYIRRIEALVGAPVTMISVGPDRADSVFAADRDSAFRFLACPPDNT